MPFWLGQQHPQLCLENGTGIKGFEVQLLVGGKTQLLLQYAGSGLPVGVCQHGVRTACVAASTVAAAWCA